MIVNTQWEKIESIALTMNKRFKKKVKQDIETALELLREHRAKYGNAVEPKTLAEEVVYSQLIEFEPIEPIEPIDDLFTQDPLTDDYAWMAESAIASSRESWEDTKDLFNLAPVTEGFLSYRAF